MENNARKKSLWSKAYKDRYLLLMLLP
ncbi:MAG: hypothetical protein K0Q63_3461, partial [Paenibacillus sp.]|nr:hypothetical protein [Paenibacillus sp.]